MQLCWTLVTDRAIFEFRRFQRERHMDGVIYVEREIYFRGILGVLFLYYHKVFKKSLGGFPWHLQPSQLWSVAGFAVRCLKW